MQCVTCQEKLATADGSRNNTPLAPTLAPPFDAARHVAEYNNSTGLTLCHDFLAGSRTPTVRLAYRFAPAPRAALNYQAPASLDHFL
jgi:hypothetical protein